MSNRTVLEFNHDVDWTEDVDGLVKVLNAIRRSAPIGDKDFQETIEVHFGISYIETRHHTTDRIDERLKESIRENSVLLDELFNTDSSYCLDKT
tara:strand:+ start:981 stop:1262 length:282 start_codon:yes stop_codon:yes gene_type:complete